jgi:hypothetical protein
MYEVVEMVEAAKMQDQEGSHCIAKLYLAIKSGAHAKEKLQIRTYIRS